MADINPAARGRNQVFYDGLAADPAAGRLKNVAGLRHDAYFFSNIDDADDFAAPRGVVAVAWQANTVDDACAVGVQTTSALTSIRCITAATNPDGWVHVLCRGTQDFTETDDETPVARGTAGYVQRGFIYVNEKAAAPVLTTFARKTGTANLKLQMFPFTTAIATTGDIWKATTGTRGTDTLCKGIVSLAWQPLTLSAATDACAATLNANGDVVFNFPSGTPAGYLWVWRRA